MTEETCSKTLYGHVDWFLICESMCSVKIFNAQLKG